MSQWIQIKTMDQEAKKVRRDQRQKTKKMSPSIGKCQQEQQPQEMNAHKVEELDMNMEEPSVSDGATGRSARSVFHKCV